MVSSPEPPLAPSSTVTSESRDHLSPARPPVPGTSRPKPAAFAPNPADEVSAHRPAMIAFMSRRYIGDPREPMPSVEDADISMMRRALLAARDAAERGEVPVGA